MSGKHECFQLYEWKNEEMLIQEKYFGNKLYNMCSTVIFMKTKIIYVHNRYRHHFAYVEWELIKQDFCMYITILCSQKQFSQHSSTNVRNKTT